MEENPDSIDFYDSDAISTKKRKKNKKRSDTMWDDISDMNIKDVLYLKNKISSLKKDILKYKSKNNELNIELDKITNKNINLKNEINDLKLKLNNNELNEYGIKMKKINDNIKKDYELKLQYCNNEIKQIKNKYNNEILKLRNENKNRGNGLSPTLMAIFTQKFVNNNVNIRNGDTMKTLHQELKGMTYASKSTFEWFGKNIISNDDEKSNNGCVIGLNGYDIMTLSTMRNIANQILSVNGTYSDSVQVWANKLDCCIKIKSNPVNYKQWQSNDILYWLFNLENGKYKKKYEKQLRSYLSTTNINGNNITKKSKLLDMSIFDLEDQQSIFKHIGILTKQTNNNNTQGMEGHSDTISSATKTIQLF